MDCLRSLLFFLPLLHLAAIQTYTSPPGSPGQQAAFVPSGEFHPWRLPSGPQAWKDVLERMKAAGFNAASVYHHWGVTEPKQGSLNFDYYRSHSDFYEAAKEVGIFVMAKPGLYINAETTAGGFPGWTTNLAAKARTNATEWTNAWTPYLTAAAKAVAPFQYSSGPIITVQAENEFVVTSSSNPGRSEAMVLAENTLRNNDITKVPITHNDPGTNGRFASGLGMVDWYMWDGYPNGFQCSNTELWGEAAGESKEEALIRGEGSNYASGVVYQNLYMTFGGINWGNFAELTVYTSYDYVAPIKEDRTLMPKYSEIKLQSHFSHTSPDILVSTSSTAGTTFTNNTNVYTTLLTGAPSGSNLYVVRQTTNKNTSPVTFNLNIDTTQGALTIP
ncbi:glycoside hydrolase family 35 protein [Sphaerobolus stellatus SS14]|uniref:Unplaced genomic scaffold SPHSTscaffold_80, whole genome shotgun sequence n=1 Tax=Sphaerobolus stellatus (strain SS14) TaxID=990650 RepID=A0A0C9VBT8_SPHS4|nr:glycoside hydrolase family 35 protein [Sphaerobolus stellatus SS14]